MEISNCFFDKLFRTLIEWESCFIVTKRILQIMHHLSITNPNKRFEHSVGFIKFMKIAIGNYTSNTCAMTVEIRWRVFGQIKVFFSYY